MLAIIGSGGHARAAYECFYTAGIEITGFFDDDPAKYGQMVINNLRVLGPPEMILQSPSATGVFVAIGFNQTRLTKNFLFRDKGFQLPSAVHPRAYISPFARIGSGLFVMGAAIINPAAAGP